MNRVALLKNHGATLASYVKLSRSLGGRADYVQGGGGNTSVKFGEGLMAIKASGYRLSDLRSDAAYAVLDGREIRRFFEEHEESDFEDVEKAGSDFVKAQGVAIEGLASLRPSVEAGFHSLLDHFVAHTHSVYANLAACTEQGQGILAGALADAAYSWGWVPYTDPGARLTFRIRDEIARVELATGIRPAVLFLQNHGLIVHHDDPSLCERIHADVNARVATAFGLTGHSFPTVALRAVEDGVFSGHTPYLRDALKSGRYDRAFFLEQPLYPDQMVFLVGTFDVGPGRPEAGSCRADPKTGVVLYRMPEASARTVEETLTAVLFIAENAKRCGYTLSGMGESAQRFIANWESEKYRKSLGK
jgi:rhamnose utilization protein RhaD (predicted bifunctional aldolase and dehydrogenase)